MWLDQLNYISETEPALDLTLNSDWLANQCEILMYKKLVLIAMHRLLRLQRSVRLFRRLIYALLLSVYYTLAEHKHKHIDYRCTNISHVALPNQSWNEIISAFSLQLCSRLMFLESSSLDTSGALKGPLYCLNQISNWWSSSAARSNFEIVVIND